MGFCFFWPLPMQQRKTVLLFSGGLDSSACLNLLLEEGIFVTPLFVNFGQAAAVKEMLHVKKLTKLYSLEPQFISASSERTFSHGEIPGRNMYLILTALVFLFKSNEAGEIVLGIHKGTSYFDCSQAFVSLAQKVLDLHTGGAVRLRVPLLSWTKNEIWDYCLLKKVPVKLTYSCELGLEQPCEICSSCKDLKVLYVN